MKTNLLTLRKIFIIFGIFNLLFSTFNQPIMSYTETPTDVEAYIDWTDMIDSRKNAINSLPAYANYPDNATNWEEYAEMSIEDLLSFDDCWINISGGNIGFRPYVKGADGWGGEDWTRESHELIATIDVIWPLYRYLQLHPNSTRQSLVEEFINSLPLYYSQIYQQTTNGPGETRHDSWYYMENSILKWGHLFMMSQASVLEEPYYGSLGSAIEMANNFNYLFPQFVSVITKLQTTNTNINYGTSGLLAYSLINAYEMTSNITYLYEAENALKAMRAVEQPYKLMYEPQEVAAGVGAAAKMIQYSDLLSSTTNFAQLAVDLFYAGEQVLYYDGGQIDWTFGFNPVASPWLPSNWRDGMHSPYANPMELGSGGINAPAAKENIEAVMFWADYLRNMYYRPDFKAVEPLKILNLNRIKHFYFFSPTIPDQYERFYGPITKQFVPYEDIDYYMVRGAYDPDPVKAGYNGKEIYGAGETIWLYLMFEALAEASDDKAMILNLNIFDKNYPEIAEDREYIVFNPYNEVRSLTFTLKNITEGYSLYANETNLGNYLPGDSFDISLPALGSAYITLQECTITTTTTTTTSDTTTTSSITTTSDTTSESSTTSSGSTDGFSLLAIASIVVYALINPRKKK